MNSVVDLGQVAFDIPAKLLSFLFFKTLKFFNQVEFEFDEDSSGELEGNVFIGEGSPRSAPAFETMPIAPVFRSIV
jgi:hypothetical protein